MAKNTNANWADVDVKVWLLYINPHNVNQSFTSNMIYKCYAFNYNDVCNKQNCTTVSVRQDSFAIKVTDTTRQCSPV
jgi:hypothetical protein